MVYLKGKRAATAVLRAAANSTASKQSDLAAPETICKLVLSLTISSKIQLPELDFEAIILH